ncbi:hypothetical protein F5877DRAFT_84738 [Lentinula edodes]|nr:hypothetical protein F5877DRAFT_84738 [Lentinula edodes]
MSHLSYISSLSVSLLCLNSPNTSQPPTSTSGGYSIYLGPVWVRPEQALYARASHTPPSTITRAPIPVSPPVFPLPHPNSAEMTINVAINELASTIEEPPLGQLALFHSVFGIGVSLARYIINDPLWPLLAAAELPLIVTIKNPASWSGVGSSPPLMDTPDPAALFGGPINEIVYSPPLSEESGSN